MNWSFKVHPEAYQYHANVVVQLTRLSISSKLFSVFLRLADSFITLPVGYYVVDAIFRFRATSRYAA